MRTPHSNEPIATRPTLPNTGPSVSAPVGERTASTRELAEELVALYRAENWAEVVERLCAEDVIHAEADPPFGERAVAGKAMALERHTAWVDGREFHSMVVRGPYLDGANRFAIHLQFDLTEKATGERKMFEEVAVFEVREGKIVREDFLY